MKPLMLPIVLSLILNLISLNSLAMENADALLALKAKCSVDTERQSLGNAVVLSCSNGQSYEIKILAPNNECSSSVWCSSLEHCVDGECVPKNVFNKCDAFKRCSLGEKCINGVCK